MPSKSEAQKRFFNAASHNPRFAKAAGIGTEAAKEWHEADKANPNKKLPEKVKKKSTTESLLSQWVRKC